MNEDQILYYLFLFFVNLGIFVSLTTFMVLKGWLPYPGGESKSDTERVSQQSRETRFMPYVKCINNKKKFKEGLADTFEPELIMGQVYKVLPLSSSERTGGMIRVIDRSGKAHLYPQNCFEPIEYNGVNGNATTLLTVHLPNQLKDILYAEALAANKSMSDLAREWIEERIEERLDLPSGQ